jgi:glycosyltransferase involved in cell wall biosynthesis
VIKISVIIPTYNRAYSLERAIKSVLTQSFPYYELIVVDDGSTDDTANLLEKYPQIKVISQANQGVSVARNNAVKQAQGKYLAFLDSDDEWLEHKLEKQYEFLQKNDYVCVHSDEIWVRNGVRVNPMKKHQKGGGDQFKDSLSLCVISPSTIMLQKDVFNQLGGFREDYPVCEDYDLWLKLTARYKIGYIDDLLIKKFGGHQDQLSRKYFAMDFWRVRSIDEILDYQGLSMDKKEAAIVELLKKATILLKGYQKHQNLGADYQQIKSISDKWQTYLS